MFDLFPDELEIKDQITNCLSYCTAAAKFQPNPDEMERVVAVLGDNEQGKAAISDDDLYFVRSVLVSTKENLNDDIFPIEDTWAARHTPSHKPTNIEHDEHVLTGHVVDNWAINSDGSMIQDGVAVDDLPDIFHIITSSVIYKQWQDDELNSRTTQLIADIESGQMYVSMECVFSNFDYGFKNADGTIRIEERTKVNAHKTRLLRCYGGTGKCDGEKIYRVLRNLTFTAFGFVKKPANPNSIIFSDISEISLGVIEGAIEGAIEGNFEKKGEIITEKEKACINPVAEADNSINVLNISETDMSEARIKELEEQLAEANDKLAKADVEKLQADNEALGAELTEVKSELETAKDNVGLLTASKTELEASLEGLQVTADEATATLAGMKAEAIKAGRVTMLVEKGFDKEAAEAKVELFANLNDEQFTDLVAEIAKPEEVEVVEAEVVEETEEEVDETDEVVEAAEEVLEEEIEEDVNLNVASEVEDECAPQALAKLLKV